ncbi:MAG: CDP-archaeol synthase [Alphaproteobacteria bacterium]|nr:CDP-archaeol synthase [Alphaproteobacteria bacterium]MBQ8367940.1 CDP-archaeol synthase [Alphaproteobacteria bacterium]
MSNTTQRIIVGCIMAAIAAGLAILEYFGIPAVRYMGIIVVLAMIVEYILCLRKASGDVIQKNWMAFGGFLVLLFVMLAAINVVGARPWIVLLMLMIICAADIGAWFFGRMIGGDKMWERLSAGKTWSGQIAGIICGTFAGVMYGLLGADTFMPQLMWIGISVSLLSQYGDLTASAIKRKLGIKDFGKILAGHGGVLDRFDGWIYALPLIWLVML